LADEPTGNLDGDTGHKVMDLLFSLKERCNTTMMLVTHQPELAERCERTIAMLDGNISDDG
ncbi:MAG: ABC transporter, partial [Rhodospirillaceae bacterium]|nr:ABC transporter [Rhodospirillaceae bacterium]